MPLSPLSALPRRPLALWLALLIAVFGALAPTVSRALALARSNAPPALLDICTSSGPRWVTGAAPGAQADTQDPQAPAQALAHCPFCLLLAEPVLPTPPFSPHFLAAPRPLEQPAAWPVVFGLTHFALTPPPRGPPAVS